MLACQRRLAAERCGSVGWRANVATAALRRMASRGRYRDVVNGFNVGYQTSAYGDIMVASACAWCRRIRARIWLAATRNGHDAAMT